MLGHDVQYGSVGARIKTKRVAKGWTQDELAKKAGTLTRGHLSLVERDATHVTAHVLRGICNALNVSSDELLYGYKAPVSQGKTNVTIEEMCVTSKEAMRGLGLAIERNLIVSLFEFVNNIGAEKTAELMRPENQSTIAAMPTRAFGSLVDFLVFSAKSNSQAVH